MKRRCFTAVAYCFPLAAATHKHICNKRIIYLRCYACLFCGTRELGAITVLFPIRKRI